MSSSSPFRGFGTAIHAVHSVSRRWVGLGVTRQIAVPPRDTRPSDAHGSDAPLSGDGEGEHEGVARNVVDQDDRTGRRCGT